MEHRNYHYHITIKKYVEVQFILLLWPSGRFISSSYSPAVSRLASLDYMITANISLYIWKFITQLKVSNRWCWITKESHSRHLWLPPLPFQEPSQLRAEPLVRCTDACFVPTSAMLLFPLYEIKITSLTFISAFLTVPHCDFDGVCWQVSGPLWSLMSIKCIFKEIRKHYDTLGCQVKETLYSWYGIDSH